MKKKHSKVERAGLQGWGCFYYLVLSRYGMGVAPALGVCLLPSLEQVKRSWFQG